MTDTTDTPSNTTTTTTTTTTWLKTLSNECSNCHWDGPQTSHVDCHSKLPHWPSSQRQCYNCVDSSGLSAELVSQACERVNPREWELRGEDGREVMSPAQESPPAKLIVAPRPLCQTSAGTSFFNGHEAVRSNLAPYPSTCTGASAVEGPGFLGHTVYPPQNKRAYRPSSEGSLRRYGRDGGTPPIVMPGSIPERGQAQPARVGGQAQTSLLG